MRYHTHSFAGFCLQGKYVYDMHRCHTHTHTHTQWKCNLKHYAKCEKIMKNIILIILLWRSAPNCNLVLFIPYFIIPSNKFTNTIIRNKDKSRSDTVVVLKSYLEKLKSSYSLKDSSSDRGARDMHECETLAVIAKELSGQFLKSLLMFREPDIFSKT